jgi:hypothetical protein
VSTTSPEQFNYLIEEGFLDSRQCRDLVAAAEGLKSEFDSQRVVMGGRRLFPNTSLFINKLLSSSKAWQELDLLLHSPAFLMRLQEELNVEASLTPKRVITRTAGRTGLLLTRLRGAVHDRLLASASVKQVAALVILRSGLQIARGLSALKSRLKGQVPVELLYDYSVATNGYEREIHRDSDAREIVVLIYLNSTTDEAGGHLLLHRLKQGAIACARPDREDCEELVDIVPREGTLVAFRNGDQAFHSVSLLTSESEQRYFVYGGYTRLFGRASGITTSERLPTDWALYA